MTSEKSCCPADEAPETEDNTPCCSPAPESPANPSNSCCQPEADTQSGCCSSPESNDIAGYRREPFVTDWLDSAVGKIPRVTPSLSFADHRGRWAMRWGFGRDHYRVAPGLYAVGSPDESSEVLVSANYKLSFDSLRRVLKGIDAWILVIDTKGVNVWCAAGKGTFGTEEIIRRVKDVRLEQLVSHRRLVVPQLGAPGVAAHQVKKGCGFAVVYGPVRAKDLPAFFAAGRQATAAMRRVSFTLIERAILTPVEITILRRQILLLSVALLLLGGIGQDFFSFSAAATRGGGAIIAGLAGLLGGSVITPILLPWLPGRAFALKGVLPGLVLAVILGASLFAQSSYLNQSALLLFVPTISSYTAMNFTGSSTFTSPSGVEKEMRLAIPAQLAAVVLALALWLWTAF